MAAEDEKTDFHTTIFEQEMNKNHQTGALLIACITIVATLSFIQFYLVRNTYLLTKSNYYTEVKKAMSALTDRPVITALEERAMESLRQNVYRHVNNQNSSIAFFNTLKSSIDSFNNKQTSTRLSRIINQNSGIGYRSQFDEIVVEYNGKTDTLLNTAMKPVIYIGHPNHVDNALLLNKDFSILNRTTTKTGVSKKQKSLLNLRVLVRLSHYADISSWKTEVYRRMAGILLLATGLILAVIILFYLIFSALIRQKRLTEIKTDFANNITHELKTPLSSVNLILKSIMLKEVQAKPEILADLLQSLGRQHGKIQILVDHVLESAMVTDANTIMEELDITRLLLEYVHDLTIADHFFSADIQDKPMLLTTNAALIEKMLNILIDNAIKYSEANKPIIMKAFADGKYYIIEITDQGIGISKQHHTQIFDKFYRIPELNQHNIKGLGLGLYLCMQAAVNIRAALSVKSEKNLGSTFTIKLPL